MRATINHGYYYFFLKSHVGFSLMIGGIPLKMRGYKTRAIINQARLITACVRYLDIRLTGERQYSKIPHVDIFH